MELRKRKQFSYAEDQSSEEETNNSEEITIPSHSTIKTNLNKDNAQVSTFIFFV
jgi:hypothetical protein